jgi:hypothetical protein
MPLSSMAGTTKHARIAAKKQVQEHRVCQVPRVGALVFDSAFAARHGISPLTPVSIVAQRFYPRK